MNIKRLIIAVLILFAAATQSYAADKTSPAEDERQMDIEERLERIESILGRTKLGGWIDAVYSDNDKEDSRQFFDLPVLRRKIIWTNCPHVHLVLYPSTNPVI